MRPKAPCRGADGVDCPKRHVGCHSECERYRAFRSECDKLLSEKRREDPSRDYAAESIHRHRRTLKYTYSGKKAISQW